MTSFELDVSGLQGGCGSYDSARLSGLRTPIRRGLRGDGRVGSAVAMAGAMPRSRSASRASLRDGFDGEASAPATPQSARRPVVGTFGSAGRSTPGPGWPGAPSTPQSARRPAGPVGASKAATTPRLRCPSRQEEAEVAAAALMSHSAPLPTAPRKACSGAAFPSERQRSQRRRGQPQQRPGAAGRKPPLQMRLCSWCGDVCTPDHAKRCRLRPTECRHCGQKLAAAARELHERSCPERPTRAQDGPTPRGAQRTANARHPSAPPLGGAHRQHPAAVRSLSRCGSARSVASSSCSTPRSMASTPRASLRTPRPGGTRDGPVRSSSWRPQGGVAGRGGRSGSQGASGFNSSRGGAPTSKGARGATPIMQENAELCSQLLRQLQAQEEATKALGSSGGSRGGATRSQGNDSRRSAGAQAGVRCGSAGSRRSTNSRGGAVEREESCGSGFSEVDALLDQLGQKFNAALQDCPPAVSSRSKPRSSPGQQVPAPPPHSRPPPQASVSLGARPHELNATDGLRQQQQPPSQQHFGSQATPRKPQPGPLPPLPSTAATAGEGAPAARADEAEKPQVLAEPESDDDEMSLHRMRQEVEAERQRYIAERLGPHAPRPTERLGGLGISSTARSSTPTLAAATPATSLVVDEVPSVDEMREQLRLERQSFMTLASAEALVA